MKKLIKKLDFIYKYRIKYIPKIFFNNRKILFYPQLPHPRTIIYKISKNLGIKIINNPKKKFDIFFYWEDNTFSSSIHLNNLSKRTLNLNCTDISKNNVDLIFEKVFGYNLSVDPKSYKGKCVVKSNSNAVHNGKIIDLPTDEIDDEVVYQKIIDNTFNENFVKDIRVPIIGNSIPFVYFKIKKVEDRFTNKIHSVEIHNTNEIFSSEEINAILKFAEYINLDYGELDVLRNNEDSKIYIVDVNKTPWGPPATISIENSKYVIETMSKVFFNYLYNNKNF
ncbi:MAG: hypothetical protein STSR0008_09230 [Ignavibacterium sp.]